jgi:hypothetical protein
MVKLTGINIGITVILAMLTLVLAGTGIYQARQAATTLLMAYRPKLAIRPIQVDGFAKDGYIGERLTNGKAWITNTGVLPVSFLFFHAEWVFSETGTLPNNNPVLTTIDMNTAPSVIKPGHVGKMPIVDYEVPIEAHIAINNAVQLEHATAGPTFGAQGNALPDWLYEVFGQDWAQACVLGFRIRPRPSLLQGSGASQLQL